MKNKNKQAVQSMESVDLPTYSKHPISGITVSAIFPDGESASTAPGRNETMDSNTVNKERRPPIPIWRKYTLTIEEAAQYFRIGEKKLRQLVEDHRDADFVLWNGNRPQIKRKLFEQFINEHLTAI